MISPYPTVSEYFLIGRSLKSHGTSGHLRLMIEDQHKSYIKPGSYIFFNMDGSRIPFRVTSKEEGAHFVVSLEDVITKQESDRLSGLELWVPLNSIKPRHQRSPRNLNDKWEEYRISDDSTGKLFDVIRVDEYPQQLMAVISVDGKELLVPLSDQLISEIDKESKIIRMEIPEGLLEL